MTVSPASALAEGSEEGRAAEPEKPALRGVFHEVAFFVSLVSGAALIRAAPTAGSTLAVTIYAVSVSLLFGISALFHRHTWGPVGRRRMRRADHSTIFVAIAGSYTRPERWSTRSSGPIPSRGYSATTRSSTPAPSWVPSCISW
jgi:predicted membrane channel-forming protein YqfA (hemolysin III family)